MTANSALRPDRRRLFDCVRLRVIKAVELFKHLQTVRKVFPFLLLSCLALAYGIIVDPATGHHGIPCLWKTVFGVTCPGCGLTRAWAFLLRGRWREAGEMNRLIFPLLLVYVGHFVSSLARSTRQVL